MLEILNPANALSLIGGFLSAGGPVVVALMLSSFVLSALLIERGIYFAGEQKRLAAELKSQWESRSDHSSWYAHAIRERLISVLRIESERYMGPIKVLVLVTPLLGLLGTVTGMIEVFQVIMSADSSNARLMASGISRATIPTMTGLAISLCGLFLVSLMDRRIRLTVGALGDSLQVQAPPQPQHGGA